MNRLLIERLEGYSNGIGTLPVRSAPIGLRGHAGENVVRGVRVPAATWERVQGRAKTDGVVMSRLMIDVLE